MSAFHPLFAFWTACLVVSLLLIFGVLETGLIAGMVGWAVMLVTWLILESAAKAPR